MGKKSGETRPSKRSWHVHAARVNDDHADQEAWATAMMSVRMGSKLPEFSGLAGLPDDPNNLAIACG